MQGGYIRQERPYVTFGILRLGDAVQRWLRHPEPSSWSYKSTIKEKFLYDSCGSSRELSNAERCLASPRQGNADPYEIKPEYSQQTKEKIYSLSRQRRHWIHARHALLAGVQSMRARICSAFSCDMFARVVVCSCGERKTTDFYFTLCRTYPPRTTSCD